MKAGDLVHVPADVNLTRIVPHSAGPTAPSAAQQAVIHYKTKVPKKAMFVEHLDNMPGACYIEYGENTWMVLYRHIKLLE